MRKEKHKVKVLILTEFFPESEKGEITGGVEARCFFVKRFLEQRGYTVKVISRSRQGGTLSLFSLGPQIVFGAQAFREGLGTDFGIIEGTNFLTYFPAWALGTLKRKPVVFWYPDVFAGSWVKNIGAIGVVGEIGERVIWKLPGVFYLAISQTTKDKLVRRGIKQERIKVIACGVDGGEIKKTADKKLAKKYDVCVVSRLVPYKRVEDAIKAIGEIGGLKAAIVGQGPEKGRLEKLAKRLGGERNISFLGHLPSHAEVLEIMAQSRVFCFPTIAEGFGIAAIEAAALGVPAVLSDIPVLREITEGGKGALFFESENVLDLAEKIRLLLTDEKLYSQKAREAKELAKKYDWVKIAEETAQVYERLVKLD